jgi:hypothetical protein
MSALGRAATHASRAWPKMNRGLKIIMSATVVDQHAIQHLKAKPHFEKNVKRDYAGQPIQ